MKIDRFIIDNYMHNSGRRVITNKDFSNILYDTEYFIRSFYKGVSRRNVILGMTLAMDVIDGVHEHKLTYAEFVSLYKSTREMFKNILYY